MPTVTADEVALAETDARCRESSGFREAAYSAEWSEQDLLVKENIDALTAELEYNKDMEVAIRAVVGRLAAERQG
jgi:hypothetical protein